MAPNLTTLRTANWEILARLVEKEFNFDGALEQLGKFFAQGGDFRNWYFGEIEVSQGQAHGIRNEEIIRQDSFTTAYIEMRDGRLGDRFGSVTIVRRPDKPVESKSSQSYKRLAKTILGSWFGEEDGKGWSLAGFVDLLEDSQWIAIDYKYLATDYLEMTLGSHHTTLTLAVQYSVLQDIAIRQLTSRE